MSLSSTRLSGRTRARWTPWGGEWYQLALSGLASGRAGGLCGGRGGPLWGPACAWMGATLLESCRHAGRCEAGVPMAGGLGALGASSLGPVQLQLCPLLHGMDGALRLPAAPWNLCLGSASTPWMGPLIAGASMGPTWCRTGSLCECGPTVACCGPVMGALGRGSGLGFLSWQMRR